MSYDMANNKITIDDFDIIKDIQSLKNVDIIIFGAGMNGNQAFKVFNNLEYKVKFFCDSDKAKQGKTLKNTMIISPEDLMELYKNCRKICVAICIPNVTEAMDLMKNWGLYDAIVITFWGIQMIECFYSDDSNSSILQDNYHIWQFQNKVNRSISFIQNILSLLWSDEDKALLLTPGKVATLTLSERLNRSKIEHITTHTFKCLDAFDDFKTIWDRAITKLLKGKLKVITAVREPLSRDYSAFWQPFSGSTCTLNIKNRNFFIMYNTYIDLILDGNSDKVEPFHWEIWRDEFNWFDEEVKSYLDIDVYEYPFDRDVGYQIIRKDNIELFVFKIEKFEQITKELCDFLGINELTCVDTNVAAEKSYAIPYKEFKKKIKLPARYVNHYYDNNKLMNHFYTEEEKKVFLNKWKDIIE